jgi:hypothetical protein
MQQLPSFRRAVPSFAQAIGFAVGVAGALPALAAGTPAWAVSGFGTLSMVHSSQHKTDFTSYVLKAGATGESEAWSPDVDSRLGVQVDLAPGQRWSAVLQAVSEQQYDNSYTPAIEWANVKWQATPELAVRVGRITLPLFFGADYRKIGYAYPWARPPVKVYGAIPVSSSDGVDLTWQWEGLGVRHSTQAYFGRRHLRLADKVRLHRRRIAGIANTMQYGAASARISMMRAKVTIDAGAFASTLGAFGTRGQALYDEYRVDHQTVSVVGAGFDYDPGPWFVSAEANRLHTHSFLGSARAVRASTGYRWGALTPWAGYTRIKAGSPASDAGLSLAGLAPDAARAAAAINVTLNSLRKVIPQQSTVSTGLRWDFRRDFALKLEYQRIIPRSDSRGSMDAPAGPRPDGPIEVASVALDFVF